MKLLSVAALMAMVVIYLTALPAQAAVPDGYYCHPSHGVTKFSGFTWEKWSQTCPYQSGVVTYTSANEGVSTTNAHGPLGGGCGPIGTGFSIYYDPATMGTAIDIAGTNFSGGWKCTPGGIADGTYCSENAVTSLVSGGGEVVTDVSTTCSLQVSNVYLFTNQTSGVLLFTNQTGSGSGCAAIGMTVLIKDFTASSFTAVVAGTDYATAFCSGAGVLSALFPFVMAAAFVVLLA